ncbi:MAG: T9SS type A sorting domain-containing protein, partial [Bacteroidetes bacterium]|nr:T9SS type A sorting domain-containing protein [Bacteroidota bacterium]
VSIGGLHSFTASKNRNLIAVFSERKTDISGIEIPAGEGIIVVPDVQSARVVWNDLSEATGYKLLITDSSGTLICTLEFDANGRLITLVYTPDALKSDEVFGVRLINLTENTTYYYTMEIFGKNNAVIETKTGTFTTKGGGVGIAETLQATSLQVYPNPTTGQLTISGGVETHGRASLPQTVEIYDNTGRFVGVEYFRPTQNNGLTIDISHLPNGVYFVAVNGKRVKVVKN